MVLLVRSTRLSAEAAKRRLCGVRSTARPCVLLLVLFTTLALAGPATGQAEPETVADEFNRGFQSMAWAGLVQRIHPEGLAYVRLATDVLVQADPGDWVLAVLLGGVDPDAYGGLDDAEVVRRTLEGVQREAPGLLSSLVARRTETLGTVAEGDARHVVYRIQMQVSGSEPEIRVMTLRRHQGSWRVVQAEDLSVLHTAIRGIPIPR